MDELKKLYDVLYREGKYTKSFEEFQTKWGQDQAYKEKVFEVVSRDGLYTKDKDSFFQKYLGTAAAQIPVAEEVKKNEDTVSPFVDGGSERTEFDQEGSVFKPGEGISIPEDVKPAAIAPTPVKESESTFVFEKPFFTGFLGEAIKSMDNPSTPFGNLGIGDFLDDIGRGVASGFSQGQSADATNPLFIQGAKVSDSDLEKYLAASKDLERFGPSNEMQAFTKTYQDEGSGIYGFIKGLAQDPTVLGELLVSSYSAMANPSSISSGLGALGAGAAGGAAIGTIAGGVGAAPGAVAGTLSAIPVALGLAGGVLEVGLTFSELLNEKLNEQELDFTKENVRKILEDKDALNEIRTKSAARGATIGVIDALTGRLAGKVGAKILRKTPEARGTATAVSSAIEATGGSAGESAGRLVAGQEQDIMEIGLEGITSAPISLLNVTAEMLKKPIYKINGERVTEQSLNEIINTSSGSDLSAMNIQISNDNKGLVEKIQNKVVTNSIKEQVRQGNPDLNEPSLNAITELEKELKKLEGNTTQTGKDKSAAIRGQIKNIQENQIQEEAVTETITAEQDAVQVPVQEEVSSGVFDLKEIGKNIKPVDLVRFQELSESLREGELLLKDNVDPSGNKLTAEKKLQIEKSVESTKQKIQSLSSQVDPQPQTVETLRAQEQAELTETLTDAEQYMVDGVIDGEKITDPAEKKIFDDIYDKYDELITPLIEAEATPEVALQEEAATDPERIATLPIDQVSQDPARFQYKSDVDPETGVSEKLKSRKFQRSLAGVISVWVDPNDGKTYVINGHHRLDLAKSTGQKNIDVRYIESANAEQARVIGAMQNIAEGQGTDVDAAKIFRSGNLTVEQLKETGLSMTDSKVRKGFALSKLSDGLFNLVVSGDLDVNKAVIIGENIPSKDVQEQFFKMIKGKNLTNSTIQVMAQDIQAAPKKKEVVADLFGTTTTEIADYEKRASLVAGIRDVISRAKNLLGKAAKGKDFLEEYGNQIDQARSEGVSKEAAEAIAVFDVLRNTSPEISTIIKESFEKLQAGETKSTIINEAAKRIIAITPQILGRRDAKNDKARSEVSRVEQTKESVEVEGKLDELLKIDPKERGAGQKALDYLDGLIKDYDDIQSDGLGVNIALPAIKVMLKGIRALVQTGVSLNDAIKRIAKENNFSVKDVVSGINAVSQILPIQKEFDALMTKADALINTQKSKDIDQKKIVSNLDTMVRNSEVYKNANDAQRKIMELEARVKAGVGPRKAASIGRVIGVLKDITNVTRQEKLQIISRIRELGRDVAKDLTAEIRALNKTGKISLTQATNIISRLGKVNMLNEKSVVNFIDYMTRVFADANYDNKINIARGKLKAAMKNVSTKIGIADGLIMPLQRLFSINPTLIPETKLTKYMELLEMFSARQTVLTLDEKSSVQKEVDSILKEIDIEQSRVFELAEVFSESNEKVFDEDKLDYASSLNKMLEEGEITQADLDIMKKYKQDILSEVDSEAESKESVDKKKLEQISELKKILINSTGLPTRDEKVLANRLDKLIKNTYQADLMKLGLTDLKNLIKVADNINNGYLPHYAQVMVEKVEAIKYGKILAAAIKRAKPLSFSALYSKLKALVIQSKRGGISELIRRNPLFYIDQVLGDFKTKDVFNALLETAAEGEANFKAELKKVQNILENAEAKIAKSFKLDPEKTLMSKFKMMTYMIQLEFESNKGNEQVNPAAQYLNATIKHIDGGKAFFKERDANMLQQILTDYGKVVGKDKNGKDIIEIDNEKLFKSFNQAEKDAINDIRGINESLKDKAQYTAAIIRGDAIDPLNNYVHLNVLSETEPLDMSAATDFMNQANDTRRPSTKAKSLIERTKGAKPLNFDVFASAQRGAKFVLMDYNLTEPIRTARRTLNQATADLEADGRLPKQQRDIKNAIENAFEESVTNLLTNSILQNTFADEVIDFIGKQGYRAVLAGTGRFAAELTSNVSFALLADPKGFVEGIKYRDVIMSTDAPLILENVNSKQTNRIFPSDTLSGRLVDASILNQAAGIQGSRSKNPVFNKMQQIYNLTIKKPKNVIELAADTLISTPDKLVMRPLWFGSFASEFKKVAGKDVDFKKIAANDQAYMDANKDAIEQSKKLADEKSVMAGATDNAFMGILKGTLKPNQSGYAKAFNNFNNYMTRFLIFEYVTARTAVYAMVGDGSLSKKQGAAMLGAVFTRMTVYTLLSQMLANGIMGLVGFNDDEEEDEKSLIKKIGQSMTGAFTSLLFGRDFGNATKLAINYGLEEFNERHFDFLREGEYDPYKDGIAFSLIPREDRPNDNIGNFLMSLSGSLGPALNTGDLIYRNRTRIITGETTKKEADAIEREDRTIKERIPLEILGHLGFVPLYKDVRKAVNKSIYSSILEAERSAAKTKKEKTDLLGGYENKTDLKRYNPDLYEKNFGKGSEWYESTKEEREEKEREVKEERMMKDRLNNYYPKEDGFGSSGFGKKNKKSKDGFGSSGFDKD